MLEKYFYPLMAFVDVGTFFVWIAFAHVFYLRVRRQRRPRFIIHAEGYECKDMKLVFTNMAAEAVYVRNVFFSVEENESKGDDGCKELYNLEDMHGKLLFKKEVSGGDECEYQGTILSGTSVKIEINGVFHPCTPQDDKNIQQDAISIKPSDTVNVFVVFIRGADDVFLGASRHFKFNHSSAGDSLEALSWDTTIWSTRHEQKKLMKALKQERNDYPGFI